MTILDLLPRGHLPNDECLKGLPEPIAQYWVVARSLLRDRVQVESNSSWGLKILSWSEKAQRVSLADIPTDETPDTRDNRSTKIHFSLAVNRVARHCERYRSGQRVIRELDLLKSIGHEPWDNPLDASWREWLCVDRVKYMIDYPEFDFTVTRHLIAIAQLVANAWAGAESHPISIALVQAVVDGWLPCGWEWRDGKVVSVRVVKDPGPPKVRRSVPPFRLADSALADLASAHAAVGAPAPVQGDEALGWILHPKPGWEAGPMSFDFVTDHLDRLGIPDSEIGDYVGVEVDERHGVEVVVLTWKTHTWRVRLSGSPKGVHPGAAGLVAWLADTRAMDLYWIHPRGAPYQQAVLVPRSLEPRYRAAGILGPKAKRVEPLPPNG